MMHPTRIKGRPVRLWICIGAGILGGIGVAAGADSSATADEQDVVDTDALLDAGQALWDAYAPPEVKAEYDFPTRAAMDEFLGRLEHALDEGTFEDMAGYAPDARRALAVIRTFEGGDELADWLEPRLDFLTASQLPIAVEPEPKQPVDAKPSPITRRYWDDVVVSHAVPTRAGDLVPRLKQVFAAEGIPPEWVWIAEVESSMNPKARSPVGARGLFQFMPATARRFGLSTSLPDERTDPEKSARAAARYLRLLHGKFGSWPLAIAAYNAGEGRVARTLQAVRAESYVVVERRLPAETRLYVPKVLATVAKRESIADPAALPAPRAPSGP